MSQKNQSDCSCNKWRELEEKSAAESKPQPQATGVVDEVPKQGLNDLVNKLEKDVDAYKNQALRAQAELDNIRRRLERDVENAHKYGIERLIIQFLPIVDSLSRGLDGIQSDDPNTQSIRQGMEITLDMLKKILEKNGVSLINPAPGDSFDPLRHEAMSMQHNPDVQSHAILQVLQPGYLLHDRVIRAAMVIVAS